MLKRIHLLLLVMIIMLGSCNVSELTLYVSHSDEAAQDDHAFRTIEDAMEMVSRLRNEGEKSPITISIKEGDYYLNKPILITPDLGPLNLRAASGAKVTIKGSELLDLSWQKNEGQLYVSAYDDDRIIDQLYINGIKQVLARYPNYKDGDLHWNGYAEDAIDSVRVQGWSDPAGALVHALHSGEWGGFHYKVTGKENGKLSLTGGHQNNRPSKMHKTYRMVENVFEELDTIGEWIHKNDTIYYYPIPEVNLAEAKVEVPVLKHLIEVRGSEKEFVKDITIEGIHFEHTSRTFMENYEPLLRSDWTIYRGGAILLDGVERVEIKNCDFTDLGGNAIFVSNYAKEIAIRGNHIYRCGGSAICFVGSPEAVRSPAFQYGEFVPLNEMDLTKGPKSDKYPSTCLVSDNLIHDIGTIEKQTAGIQIAMAMDITVRHNSIYNVPRAGINIGDGTWGGHILEYNDVFNTVLETGDHGAFNSWGRDRFWHPNRSYMDSLVKEKPEMPFLDAIHTTIIRNNRFQCDHGWDIDLDDGSSNYHIYNNLCLSGGLKLREGFDRTVENNILINNGFHPHVWFENSQDIFRRNIVFNSHRDIRLGAWGKEVDYNFFTTASDLAKVQEKGVDSNSITGRVAFEDPVNGNYNLKPESDAYKVGFEEFDQSQFGVQSTRLKPLAQSPKIPQLIDDLGGDTDNTYTLLGAHMNNIRTMEQRSAAGLDETRGVIIQDFEAGSDFKTSGFLVGDVILGYEGSEIKSMTDLLKSYEGSKWKSAVQVEVFRNQQPINITLKIK